jgi:hypothetical protein
MFLADGSPSDNLIFSPNVVVCEAGLLSFREDYHVLLLSIQRWQSFGQPWITCLASPLLNHHSFILISDAVAGPGPPECDDYVSQLWALGVFIAAMLVLSIGSAPVYILGPTYLYDNVHPKNFSLYAGKQE